MGSPLERRRSQGRRRVDDRDILALRGVLHDVGHELTTLSYLVEAVRGDTHLPEDSSYRLELLALEMDRLHEMIRHGLDGLEMANTAEPVKLRELATQLIELAGMAYEADVKLLSGPEVSSTIHPLLLWRVMSNIVDNAARAAGPGGLVTVAVGEDPTPVIDIADTGPGFGAGPPGQASLGLTVVMSLLEACGGSLTVSSPSTGGTIVRLTLPAQAGVPAGMGG